MKKKDIILQCRKRQSISMKKTDITLQCRKRQVYFNEEKRHYASMRKNKIYFNEEIYYTSVKKRQSTSMKKVTGDKFCKDYDIRVSIMFVKISKA